MPGKILEQQRLLFSTTIDYFSFGILFRTLFQPWKRDVIATEHLPFQERFNVWALNQMSRLVGAAVRGAAIIVGGLVLLVLIFFCVGLWLVWLGAPFIALALFVIGLVVMFGGFR